MEAGGGGPDWTYRPKGPQRPVRPEMLAMWRVNPRAVAASRQYAILGFAHIRNAHGKPYADGHQGDRKCDRSDVSKHAMAKVVRFIAGALIGRQIIRFGTNGFRFSMPARETLPTRSADRVARPELE